MVINRRQSKNRTFKSWKGPDGYKRAEAIENRIRLELGKEPTKKDFKNAGLYNVWMALYRSRRKVPDRKESQRQYQSFRVILLRNNELMEKVLYDLIATMGPTRIEEIINDVTKNRF